MNRPTSSSKRSAASRPELVSFVTFVTNVITRAEVTTSTLLATLAYIDRARPYLQIGIEEWAHERVFLGALIVAAKVRLTTYSSCLCHHTNFFFPFFILQYLNDSTLKNVHWALCTGVFGKRDVGRIEREFLDVLGFELKITENDLLEHYDGLMTIASPMMLSPQLNSSPVHHRRNHKRTSMSSPPAAPALVPSSPDSPSSSSSSDSPQTPSPNYSQNDKDEHSTHPIAATSKSMFEAIIRSFPIPSYSHSRHNKRVAEDRSQHQHHSVHIQS